MGPPTGRKTRWGKAGAPQRRGLLGAKRRVSTSKAEAAPAVAEGQHDSSGGAPDEAVPRVAPPEEIAGYATVRICGETAAGEKERANEWCEDFLGCRKAGGAAVGRGMNPPAGEKKRYHVHLPAGAPA